MGILIKRIDGSHAGHVYIERDDIAENLIDVGSAIRVKPKVVERATAPEMETPEMTDMTAGQLMKCTVPELKQECERRGINLNEGTGLNGKITKTDLVDALS